MNGVTLRAHLPVMLTEVMDALLQRTSGYFVDATFGRGGHTEVMLARLDSHARVFAFDRDPEAVKSRPDLAADPRLEIIHAPFSAASTLLAERGVAGNLCGVLLDLGVSSPQLDDPARGFSFRADGPLDMRMDPTRGQSVADWLNAAPENVIRDCLWELGEERKSRQIAARICETRRTHPFTTTHQLAGLVRQIVRTERRIDPSTRTFQALRLFINDELGELRRGLATLADMLAIAGRLVVISFHSLEDRIVKRYFRDLARNSADEAPGDAKRFRVVFRRPLVPTEDEIAQNPRARSARLRVLERVG